MSLKERLVELKSLEDLDIFLKKHSTCALFKAGACHKTMQGFGYVEEALDQRDNIHMAFVRVIEYRPVSNKIAELTGIIHQSPQFILIVDGKPIYEVDNWNITPQALEDALFTNFGPVSSKERDLRNFKHADTKPYKELLVLFVSGKIDEEMFKSQWLNMFQQDSTLRSTQEFDLLNSLFGDVDKAIGDRAANAAFGRRKEPGLKSRAESLLNKLQEL